MFPFMQEKNDCQPCNSHMIKTPGALGTTTVTCLFDYRFKKN